MMKSTVIFALCTLLTMVAAQAQNYGTEISNCDELLEQLSVTGQSTTSINCRFTLEKSVSLMNETQLCNGNFYYKRDGARICLDYIEPKGNKIIMTQTGFIIETAGNRAVLDLSQNPGLSQIRNVVIACTTGDFSEIAERSQTKYFENDEFYTIVIEPTNKRIRRYMSEITLQFDKTNNSLATMRLTESNGDFSQYSFSNKKFNTAVDDSHFQ